MTTETLTDRAKLDAEYPDPETLNPGGSLDDLAAVIAEADPSFADEWAELKASNALKLARKAAGFTQEQVAEILGIDKSRIVRLENHPEKAQVSRLTAYAKAIGISIEIGGSVKVRNAYGRINASGRITESTKSGGRLRSVSPDSSSAK